MAARGVGVLSVKETMSGSGWEMPKETAYQDTNRNGSTHHREHPGNRRALKKRYDRQQHLHGAKAECQPNSAAAAAATIAQDSYTTKGQCESKGPMPS